MELKADPVANGSTTGSVVLPRRIDSTACLTVELEVHEAAWGEMDPVPDNATVVVLCAFRRN